MTDNAHELTYCAVLTPAGRGAVATIAVVGPQAIELIETLFVPLGRAPLSKRALNTIVYGHWANADRADQATGEDVIVSCRSNQQGEQRVEVHCHGGVAASHAIMASLVHRGAVQATWHELVARDQPDRLRADALIALANATTERTARILLDQYHGALSNEITLVRNALRGGPELPPTSLTGPNSIGQQSTGQASGTQANQVELARLNRQTIVTARDSIQQLLTRAPLGLHLTTPWRVVLAGPPNVGKSSLINAIVGYQRSIVFDQPGTTRDVVTATTAIDGWPIELSDTAGLRISSDDLESQGVERAERQLALADLTVLVFDVTRPFTETEQRLLERFANAIVVLNKLDLVDDRVARRIPPIAMGGLETSDLREPLRVSATTGEGLNELMAAMVSRLIPNVPSVGTAVPFTLEQRAGLEQALAAVDRDELARAVEILSLLTRGR